MRNPLPSARESDSTFPDRKCDDFDARREGATNLMNIDQRDDARWSFGHVRAISRAHRAGCRVNVSFTFPFYRARISQNLPRARGTPLLWQWWAKYAEIFFFNFWSAGNGLSRRSKILCNTIHIATSHENELFLVKGFGQYFKLSEIICVLLRHISYLRQTWVKTL